MKYNLKNIELDSKKFDIIEILEKEIGLVNIADLKDIIDKELENGKIFIGIDLKNVSVINSSGLGVLISCLTKIKSKEGSFKLFNLSDKILNIFKITKLNLVFDIA